MKPLLLWLGLAALATTACVDQRSQLRRSQRPEDSVPFWQLPIAYGKQGLEMISLFAPADNLIPTSASSAASPPVYHGPGMAPIFNVFRDDPQSVLNPISAPAYLNGGAAERVASASDAVRDQLPPAMNPPETSPAPAVPAHLPFAIPVLGKPGFVTLPGRPGMGEIDVVGIAPGTPVEVPDGRETYQFRVP